MAPEGDGKMLAAVVEQFGQPYALKRIPRPADPQGHDLLIKVHAASYCHTDAVFATGGMFQDLPRVGCHEFAGEVVATGPDVADGYDGLEVGTRVGVPGRAYHPCGSCYECTHPGHDRPGYSPYCPRAFNLGLTHDGGFQEYCLVDSRQVAPLPDGLSAVHAAPLMCAGITIWAALHHDKVREARRVAILGAGGGLGHLGVQFAAHLGKEVLAVDANDDALALLERVRSRLGTAGASVHIVDGRKASVKDAQALVLGEVAPGTPEGEVGLDAAIMLPESQAAFDQGMALLRNHGTMMVVSFPKKKLEVSAADLVFRDISVVGSLVGRNHQIREMLQFVRKHVVQAEVQAYKFGDLNQLVQDSHKGGAGKLVVDMTL
ncbi:hypothetical protein DHEL01_v202594 [Diaporthe helianthi]|uniref:Enoyl reductase (ER) domain-containing protein n=1 Tax=Diaporthe helianthi TaxID=158607 RepID=A0A2P5I946_DIAHE|nr:hypothetical protein DHEL01_v202594 [Diaporthe helianthi]